MGIALEKLADQFSPAAFLILLDEFFILKLRYVLSAKKSHVGLIKMVDNQPLTGFVDSGRILFHGKK